MLLLGGDRFVCGEFGPDVLHDSVEHGPSSRFGVLAGVRFTVSVIGTVKGDVGMVSMFAAGHGDVEVFPRRRRGDDDVCGVGGDSLCSVGGDGITEIDMLRRIGGGEHDRSAEWSSSCSNREGAIIADSGDLPAAAVARPRVLGTTSPIVATCDDRVANP